MPSASLTTRDPVLGYSLLAFGLRWCASTYGASAPRCSLGFACGVSPCTCAQRARNAAYCTSSTAF